MGIRQPLTKEFVHRFSVEAERGLVWSVIWDVHAVARCVRGCQETETLEEGKSYRALVQRKLGPFSVGLTLDIAVLEARAPEYLSVEVSGDDRRLRSQLKQVISISLQEDSDGTTSVTIKGSFTLTGLLAVLNESLVEAQVGQVLEDFTSTLRQTILERS